MLPFHKGQGIVVCRFHPLPEFDEGKRSCRRRLAGHNRRRRKAQPDSAVAAATAAQAGLMVEDDRPGKGPEILSFLNILSHLQGKNLCASKFSHSTCCPFLVLVWQIF